MIQSMTGFGRGEAANEKYKVTIEMKSVNHRYLDLSSNCSCLFKRHFPNGR